MHNHPKKVLTVVGARPQFVKAAVISRHLRRMEEPPFEEILVHTGQHYDPMLSDVFFSQLNMQDPRYSLGVGSTSAAKQIGLMLEGLDPVVEREAPDAVIVYGDTNSTLAAAICSAHRNVQLVHVEAGERIYRRRFVPEEPNRVLTDHAATLCLTSTARARDYLLREGMCHDRVRFVGDPMYDLFKWAVSNNLHQSPETYHSMGLTENGYHLATIHRAENTNSRETTLSLLNTLDKSEKPIILPVHPRLDGLLKSWNWRPKGKLRLVGPQGYFDFLNLLLGCDKCITDSGGVTREAFFARKPCIIPMSNSWWTDLVEAGWGLETGSDHEALSTAIETFTAPAEAPEGLFGDGDSATRIVNEISLILANDTPEGNWHRHGNSHPHHKEQLRFGRFTYSEYQDLIQQLRATGYQFAAFPDVDSLLERQQRFVLMRHDVDLDLESARRLARLEWQMGINSTYFFLLRTEHYNVFSEQGTNVISEILELGHHLGLHFDCASYPDDMSIVDLSKACSREAEMLESWFKAPVSIVSYHRPDATVLSGDPSLSAPRRHTYMSLYNERIRYFSDSMGRWRCGSPADSEEYRRGCPLHILVHPIWWNDHSTSSYETLLRLVQRKMDMVEHSIAQNCKVYRVGRLSQYDK